VRVVTKSLGIVDRHGMSGTREHRSWTNMLTRCQNPNYRYFHRYGGRGIAVCERWLVFSNFLADMGPRPPGTTIDRIDPDGNYEPGNCRWSPWSEQRRNRDQGLRLATMNGETMCLTDWAARLGVSRSALVARLDNGMPTEIALQTGQFRCRAMAHGGRKSCTRPATRLSRGALVCGEHVVDRCGHCEDPVSDGVGYEATGLLFCSTLCAVAVTRCGHRSKCLCAEAMECWTLPRSDADRIRNAFAYQAAALAARTGGVS
jgi:hypothetical protein